MLRKILYRINQITENTRRKEKSRPISGNWIIRDNMKVSYNGLWKILIDKNMKKRFGECL